jgi:hypothetical protein
MIMRNFQVSTRPGREAKFGRFVQATAIPRMRRTDGVVTALPGGALAESYSEVGFVMIARDLDAPETFVVGDCESPHIGPPEPEWVGARTIRRQDLVDA